MWSVYLVSSGIMDRLYKYAISLEEYYINRDVRYLRRAGSVSMHSRWMYPIWIYGNNDLTSELIKRMIYRVTRVHDVECVLDTQWYEEELMVARRNIEYERQREV